MAHSAHRRRTLLTAAAGVLAVTAYATLAALNALVWDPLAASGADTLDEVHAEMAAANEYINWPVTVTILGIGITLAIVLFIFIARSPAFRPLDAALAYLVMLTVGLPASFMAGFGPGMSLGDTYGSGGDHSGWGRVFLIVSGLTLIASVIVGVRIYQRNSAEARRAAAL